MTIPTSALQTVSSIRTADHTGSLGDDVRRRKDNVWVVELLPEDTVALAPRALKLIDARTGKDIANASAVIEYRTRAKAGTTTLSSNALGYIFVPFEIFISATDRAWVTVAGYRRTHIDFSGMGLKTRLVPR